MELRSFLNIMCFLFLPTTLRCEFFFNDPTGPHMITTQDETFNNLYPDTNISRCHVPETLKYWDVHASHYKPPYIIHPSVLGQPWADPENVSGIVDKFNTLDGKEGEELDRRSARGVIYEVENKTGRPLNPTGRTGVAGRGLLGRWGPNYSAHLIVTRWVLDQYDEKVIMQFGKPLMELVAVKFHGQWGIPGGFVEPGESYMKRSRVEFMEEALNASNMTKTEYDFIEKHLSDMICEHGEMIYHGYIKDNRNTDNAWIEGAVISIHYKKGTEFNCYHLSPGDGAEEVKWFIVHRRKTLNPTHREYLKRVRDIYDAHW